ncbi:MAG: hypothetical protein L6R45_21960 [Anaerolineae bacterium]|nr:hypothetical protein [Anaerolineae bacterium]
MKHAIPTDWDGQTFCRFAICWPDSPLWRALLRGLVTEPARGFFWDEKTGYIKGVLADFRQTMDYNLQLECVIMSCGDASEVVAAINGIASKLTYNDKSIAQIHTEALGSIDQIEEILSTIGLSLGGIVASLTGPGLPPTTLLSQVEEIGNTLLKMGWEIDRIRDNLDSRVPGLNADDEEFGLATLIASFGPSLGRIDRSLQCVAEGVNDECAEPGPPPQPPTFADELAEVLQEHLDAEGIPALEDAEQPEEE